MGKRPHLRAYEELDPEMLIDRANLVYREATEEETQASMARKRLRTAYFLKFLQDNNLTNGTLWADPVTIPSDFEIRLKHISAEGLRVYREAWPRWVGRFDRNQDADPADIRILAKELVRIRAANSTK